MSSYLSHLVWPLLGLLMRPCGDIIRRNLLEKRESKQPSQLLPPAETPGLGVLAKVLIRLVSEGSRMLNLTVRSEEPPTRAYVKTNGRNSIQVVSEFQPC